MSRIQEILNRGDRASQPAATDVPQYSLYYVTDEGLTEQSDGADWQDYSTGAVVTTGSPANGNLAKFSGATSVTNGNLSGAVTTSDTLVTTLASGLNPNFASITLGGMLLQNFAFVLINSAGTIQHKIVSAVGLTDASSYASKITDASATLANTPTVGVGTDFTSGAGITSNIAVLNTAAQVTGTAFTAVHVEYYDGNVLTPTVYATYTSRNVNGTTRVRLELNFLDLKSGGGFTINTTNLPSGKVIIAKFTGFLT